MVTVALVHRMHDGTSLCASVSVPRPPPLVSSRARLLVVLRSSLSLVLVCSLLRITTFSFLTSICPSIPRVYAEFLRAFSYLSDPLEFVVITTSPCIDICVCTLLMRILSNRVFLTQAEFDVSQSLLKVSFLRAHVWGESDASVVFGVFPLVR